MVRRAIVLMNLGGPDTLDAVQPFLFNLFSDPAIIRLPGIARLPLAWAISRRRAHVAREIYAYLGGASPLLVNTEAQARALENVLGGETRCFVAMRYWQPTSREAVAAVKAWKPEQVVLLPLYPQFSTTTTASSLLAWEKEARRQEFVVDTRSVRSYPDVPGFIDASAALLGTVLDNRPAAGPLRVLFSAHGLPQRIVATGDPYPQEIERTAEAIVTALARPGLDWRICYQSRVGPLAWLTPSIDEELRRAGSERISVVVAPISFVSEHSETLVELDRDYRRFAEQTGVPNYCRVPTVGTQPLFIAALARLVHGVAEPGNARLCAG